MTRALRAGLLYFASVFAIGFALGTLRVLVIIPRIGETAAVLLEVPVMLALAWPICGRLLRRFAVPAGVAPAVMGGTAFSVLMLAEWGLAVTLFGQSSGQHWALYRTLPGQIGLVGQILFALLPLPRR
ncbi:MAG: hypothetical protein RL490_396 [Pseudomonadota bacterium]|jgi:hypothetical protein